MRKLPALVALLLAIELLDELVFGAREAAWPLIRTDLGLSYAQIGLLLGAPSLVGAAIEPFLGILGDVWRRRLLILGGGLLFATALLLTALSQGFWPLLLSFALFSPASGAFVSLSQATLMDLEPGRHEQNMARWTLAGSVGVVAGPIVLGAALAVGLGWRGLFVLLAGLALVMLALARRFSFGPGPEEGHREGDPAAVAPAMTGSPAGRPRSLRAGVANAWQALRRGDVLRWLILLQFSDLMLDVLLGFLALYFVDVAGLTPAQAGTAVAIWTGLGLLGDLLLIPLLERVSGLRYLRASAALELALFVAFLLAPTAWARLALVGLLGFFNAGWYSVLKARLYAALPGQSGTALAVNNVAGLVGGLVPALLGLAAQRFGLQATMWLLLAGPVALLAGLPRRGN